jgi:hypothetical protein
MIQGKDCPVELGAIEADNKASVNGFKMDADDAIANLIGVPNPKNKNYKLHNKFYDEMYDYFIESGDLSKYQIDPWLMSEQWGDYYNSVFVDLINKDTAQIGDYRLKSMYNKFKAIKKKRDKAIKKAERKDGMSNSARALLPPSILAMRYDRYGFISKIVKATKNISDKIKQSYSTFDSDVSKVLTSYRNNAKARYKEANLNAVLDGLKVKDKNGEIIIIHGRSVMDNGNPTLEVSYPNAPLEDIGGDYKPKRQWVSMAKLGVTEQQYEDAYILKYRDDFVNDLLHGQTRYVKWYTQDEAKGDDALILEMEQQLLKHRIDHEVDNRSRKFKTKRIRVPDPDNSSLTMWEGDIYYVMIKDGETYNTYLTGIKNIDGKSANQKNNPEMFNMVRNTLKDGFYNSQEMTQFVNHQKRNSPEELPKKGNKLDIEKYKKYLDSENEKGKLYPLDSESKAYTNFEYMEVQPDVGMTDSTTIGATANSDYANIWDVVSRYRKTYKEVSRDMARFGKRNQGKRDRAEKLIRTELKKKGLDSKEIQEWMQTNIYDVGGIEPKWWTDKNGDINTPDSIFEAKQENYAPVKWTNQEFFKMLDEAIYGIKSAIETNDYSEAELKEVRETLDELLEMQDATADRQPSEAMIDQAISIHKKRRRMWTNPLTRRKNSQVHLDYLDSTYRNLHKNELTIELIEQMYNVLKTEKQIPKGTIDYMVNRVKLANGRSDINVKVPTLLGWKDWDNTKVASMMNALPNFIKQGRTWDADNVESMWLTLNGLLTMRFLGASGAIGNRTQSLNNIVAWGWNSFIETKKEIDSRPDYWNEIVDQTGVLNLISVFNDIMLQGGDVELSDAGFAVGGELASEAAIGASVPLPTFRFINWRRIVNAGKPNFIKNGNKSIDGVLLKLIQKGNFTTDETQSLSYGRELEDIINEFNQTGGYDIDNISDELAIELNKRRGAYWDIMMSDKKNNTEDILQRRFKTLMGEIDDNLLRKMVTFKLSYWYSGFGKELFTFTEGEQAMRKETAVQALLVADKKNLLGNAPNEQDRMTSPNAQKIAREAVYQMMFGMSPVFLGEAFSGMGRTLGQYKSYPLFQTIKDYNTINNFTSGGNFVENTGRVLRAFKTMVTDKYTPEGDFDHEAAAAVRLVLTRGTATILTATAHLMPFASYYLKKIKIDGGISLTGAMRSAENPLAGTAYRAILWAILMMYGFGDLEDREEAERDVIQRMLFLTVPAILGSFVRWGYDGLQAYHDEEGIWGI